MEQVVKGFQHAALGSGIDGFAVGRFHEFEEPAGEVIPEELIDLHEGFAQTVSGIEVCHRGGTLSETCFKPFHRLCGDFGLCFVFINLPAVHEAEGVPDFVAEVSSLLTQFFIKEDVVASRSGEHHAHSDAVSTIFLNESDGVGAVAQLFGHLASEVVTHDAGEIDIAEGNVAGVFHARHNHSCHPEEDDVRSGHEVGGGIVVGKFGVVGMVDAVEEADGPEPRTEPGVECILVMAQLLGGHVFKSGDLTSLFECFFATHCHDEFLFLTFSGGQIVCRDAVSPPELAADAPVVDVFKPVAIGGDVFLRVEFDVSVEHGRQGDVGEVLHGEIPLHAEAGFHGGVGVAF